MTAAREARRILTATQIANVSPLDAQAVATHLHKIEATHHVRVVTLDPPVAGLAGGGATLGPVSIVARGDTAKLREVMERVTGLD